MLLWISLYTSFTQVQEFQGSVVGEKLTAILSVFKFNFANSAKPFSKVSTPTLYSPWPCVRAPQCQHPTATCALLCIPNGAFYGLQFVLGSKKALFTGCLRQWNGWEGWVGGLEDRGSFQKIRGLETVFTQEDEQLEISVSQTIVLASAHTLGFSGLIPWDPLEGLHDCLTLIFSA